MLTPSLFSPHQVVAIDLDEGPNGQVTYRMQVGMPRMDFLINSTSGLVTSTAVLDRERIAEYYLRVVASDAGVPSKSSTSTLTVKGGCTKNPSSPSQPQNPLRSQKNERQHIGRSAHHTAIPVGFTSLLVLRQHRAEMGKIGYF